MSLHSEFMLMIQSFIFTFCPVLCEDFGLNHELRNRNAFHLKKNHRLQSEGLEHEKFLRLLSRDEIWIKKIKREVVYVSKFFTVKTEYSKPQFKKREVMTGFKTQYVNGALSEVPQIKTYYEKFLSKEDYLNTHQWSGKTALQQCKTFLFR